MSYIKILQNIPIHRFVQVNNLLTFNKKNKTWVYEIRICVPLIWVPVYPLWYFNDVPVRIMIGIEILKLFSNFVLIIFNYTLTQCFEILWYFSQCTRCIMGNNNQKLPLRKAQSVPESQVREATRILLWYLWQFRTNNFPVLPLEWQLSWEALSLGEVQP